MPTSPPRTGLLAAGLDIIPIHFERAVKPSFPRRACPVRDTGREPTPWPHIYGGITPNWYKHTCTYREYRSPPNPPPPSFPRRACPRAVGGGNPSHWAELVSSYHGWSAASRLYAPATGSGPENATPHTRHLDPSQSQLLRVFLRLFADLVERSPYWARAL